MVTNCHSSASNDFAFDFDCASQSDRNVFTSAVTHPTSFFLLLSSSHVLRRCWSVAFVLYLFIFYHSDKTDKTVHSHRQALIMPDPWRRPNHGVSHSFFLWTSGPACAVVNSHCRRHLCCRLFLRLKQLNVAAVCVALRLDAACLVSATKWSIESTSTISTAKWG